MKQSKTIQNIESGIIKFAGVNKIVPTILAKQKLQKLLKNNGGPECSTKTEWYATLQGYDEFGAPIYTNDQSEDRD